MDDDGRGSRGPHSQGLPFGLPCSGSGREPREPHSRRFRLTRAKSRTARLLGSVCEQPLSRRLTRARSGDGRTAAAKRRRKSLARPAAPPPPPDGDGAWSAAIGGGRLRRRSDKRFYRVSGPYINSGRLRLAQRSGGRLRRGEGAPMLVDQKAESRIPPLQDRPPRRRWTDSQCTTVGPPNRRDAPGRE